MTTVQDKLKAIFTYDPAGEIDIQLKRGVLGAYQYFKKRRDVSEPEIRYSIASAFEYLARVDVSAIQEPRVKKKDMLENNPNLIVSDDLTVTDQHKPTFLSAGKGWVEFSVPDGTDNWGVKSGEMVEVRVLKSAELKKKVANKAFKKHVFKPLKFNAADKVEDFVWAGVYTILLAAEKFDGLLMDHFFAQQPLFANLGRAYRRARPEMLSPSRGAYNHGLAVDAALDSLGMEDDFDMEG